MIRLIIVAALVIGGVYWCTGGKYGTDTIFGPPDTLPFSRYEDVGVNVYFYFPDNREVYLGATTGASSCQSMAGSYAIRNNVSSGWGYICCTKEAGSECYRKIK